MCDGLHAPVSYELWVPLRPATIQGKKNVWANKNLNCVFYIRKLKSFIWQEQVSVLSTRKVESWRKKS